MITKVHAYYVIPSDSPKGYARYHVDFAIDPTDKRKAEMKLLAETVLAATGLPGHIELDEVSYDEKAAPEQRTFDQVLTLVTGKEVTTVRGDAARAARTAFEDSTKASI